MVKRTVTGIVLAGILFLFLWLTSFSQIIFDMLILVFCWFATFEMYQAVKRAKTQIEGKNGYNISKISLVFANLIVYPMCYFFNYTGLFFTAIISIVVAFFFFIFDQKRTFNDFTVNVFVLFYPIIFISMLFVLNNIYGIIPVVLAIGISTISDAFAYWVGSTLGKRKIFPKISPKKTYAGFFGGLIGGAIGSMLVYAIFEVAKFPTNTVFTFASITNYPLLVYALIGLCIAFFSEIGDLAASRIKRAVGIKDYGTILGSHGGVMDRVDSILFTTVCVSIVMLIINLVA